MPPPAPGGKAAAFVEEEDEDPEEDPEELVEEEDEEFVEEEVEETEEEVEEIEEELYEVVQVSEDEEVDEVEDQEEEEDPEEEEDGSWENLPATAEEAFEAKAVGICIQPVKEDTDKAAEETPAAAAAAAAEEDKSAAKCIQPMKEDARKVEEKARSSSFVLQSVSDLQVLQGALSEFVHRWNDLQNTLDFIQSSIERRSKELDALQRPSPSLNMKELVVKIEEEEEEEEDQGPADKLIDELVLICKSMNGKGLRKYTIKHIDEIDKLRRELPAAIRSAPDPAEVVFLSVGRFYLQGSKCYENPKNPEVNVRRAVILLLEIFILSGCVSELNPSLKKEARVAAKDWMGRIVREGGARSATTEDALVLVLFMASFGIPPEFRCMDLYDLLHSCNLRKEAHVLPLSPFLLAKLPDILKEIIQKDMHVEAVNLICSFGLEEKFPPLPLLSSLCNKSSGVVGDERGEEQRSKRSLIDGNKKHLATLKSVVQCLKENKLDPSLLEGIELSEGIAKTEKKILELEQKQKNQNGNLKRVAEEGAVCEAKRPRPASAQASSLAQASLGVPPHSSKRAQDQGGAAPISSRGSLNGLHPQNLFGGVYTGRHNGDVMRAAAGSQAVPSPTAVYHRHVPSSEDGNGKGKGSSASNLYHFADNVP